MLEEAKQVRAKVLGEVVRRRNVARVQVAQLRAGRDRLLDAYRVVRETLDEVTDELGRAEDEARARGRGRGADGRRPSWPPTPSAEVAGARPRAARRARDRSTSARTSPSRRWPVEPDARRDGRAARPSRRERREPRRHPSPSPSRRPPSRSRR